MLAIACGLVLVFGTVSAVALIIIGRRLREANSIGKDVAEIKTNVGVGLRAHDEADRRLRTIERTLDAIQCDGLERIAHALEDLLHLADQLAKNQLTPAGFNAALQQLVGALRPDLVAAFMAEAAAIGGAPAMPAVSSAPLRGRPVNGNGNGRDTGRFAGQVDYPRQPIHHVPQPPAGAVNGAAATVVADTTNGQTLVLVPVRRPLTEQPTAEYNQVGTPRPAAAQPATEPATQADAEPGNAPEATATEPAADEVATAEAEPAADDAAVTGDELTKVLLTKVSVDPVAALGIDTRDTVGIFAELTHAWRIGSGEQGTVPTAAEPAAEPDSDGNPEETTAAPPAGNVAATDDEPAHLPAP